MRNDEVIGKILIALKNLLDQDNQLLTLNASERAISHNLAEHLKKEFANWNVDCEYNRCGERTKTLPRRLFNGIKDDDQEVNTIFPDIIVHKRNHADNLLVIEVKKSNNRESDEKDRIKLKAFTDLNGEYKYKFGLFIVFDVDNQCVKNMKYFYKGQEAPLNVDLSKNLEVFCNAE